MSDDRKHRLIQSLKGMLAELAGKDLSGVDAQATFFELGFDSLLLTQVATLLKRRFQVKVSFRQILEELTSLETMAQYLDAQLPAEAIPAKAPASTVPALPTPKSPTPPAAQPVILSAPVSRPIQNFVSTNGNSLLEKVIKDQMALMTRQLEMLGGKPVSRSSQTEGNALPATVPRPAAAVSKTSSQTDTGNLKRFGPFKGIELGPKGGLTSKQEKALADLAARYNRRTAGSKAYAQRHRSYFCDPRAAGNFRLLWKEMVYPIVCAKSKGGKIWDIDGNEYVDLTLGFGANYFGHAPEFIVQALEAQVQKGFEIGPQSPLAGEVAQMFCEMTGMERATFCNTGSEAVMAAIRAVRTVTGRDKIVYFSGDYHGVFDEVLGRAGLIDGQPGALPVAPGIPSLPNIIVLEYGNPASLEIIRARADEIAAAIVEPVQTRHPDLQPREFLHALRQLTSEKDIALIFDEVVTGFRATQGGAQEFFGVRADLATYGKVVGGGMPIGVLAGSRRFMDALDGGMWQFGDDSFPQVGVTFFAGTFVRHPLVMAAAHATLKYLKQAGPGLQQQTTEKTARVVRRLNDYFISVEVPIRFQTFSSFFYYDFHPDLKFASLLFYYLRHRGIHIWEGRLAQICTAHTEEELNFIFEAFKASVEEMQADGFLPDRTEATRPEVSRSTPVDLASNGAHKSAPVVESPVVPPNPLPTAPNHSPALPAANIDYSVGKIDFSVYFFGNYPAEYHQDKYRVMIEAAKFADTNGFKAIWLPERHFHAVGGFCPNPSVLAAALARETSQLQLRAGSVVLPLHHPVRIAEEWAMVDNLSDGRVGISIASGWHPSDFVFAPDAFDRRRELCWEGYELIQRLWQGQEVEFPTGGKQLLKVKIHPLPKQARLPAWLTCIHKESYLKAGELGMGVLGYTMNTTLCELEEKIRIYREAFQRHGHDPRHANVSILMHTFVGQDDDTARQTARGPMREYLRNYLDNSQKRIENQHGQAAVDQEDIEYLLDRGFEDYVKGKALIGSPETCAATIAKMKEIGVDEIGCFLDFGIDPTVVLANLPNLAKLRQLSGDQSQNNGSPKQNLQVSRTISLPEAQKGLVAISALGVEASRAYNEVITLEFRGELNLSALRSALQSCVDRHEALRTSLDPDGETQTIHPLSTLDVQFEDISGLPPQSQSDRKSELFKLFQAKQFDLQIAPIISAQIIKRSSDRHLLVLLFHHTISNGPSCWILMEDLCAFYESSATGKIIARPDPMQFSQFVEWRASYSTTEEYGLSEKFWLEQFADGVPQLDLPTDRPRPPIKTYLGGRTARRLDSNLTKAMRKAGAAQRCSLYMFLLTGFKVLMHRLSNQNDFVVGTPFDSSVRTLPGGEGLFANTTNMTLIRSGILPEEKFAELLSATKTQILECQGNQDYFFGNLLKKLHIRSELNRPNLFSVGFNYETGKFQKFVGGVAVELLTDDAPYRRPTDVAMFDLNFNIAERDEELLCECDYDADLFNQETVNRMLEQFEGLLRAAAANPEQSLSVMPMMSEAERHQVLIEWNQTQIDYPRELTIHALFEEQVRNFAGKIAVRCEERALSYHELNLAADALAVRLQHSGATAGQLVGVFLERSVEMVVGVIGILKSGAAYVPMDPAFPPSRLAAMIEDAGMSLIVTHSKLLTALPPHHAKVICLDKIEKMSAAEISAPQAKAEDLAYVIFTSGSTGRPKGVQVQHRAVVNFLNSMRREPGMTADDVLLSVTTLSFDIAGLELFLPLTTGATLVVASSETAADGNNLRKELERRKITFMQATPVTWMMLLEAGWPGQPELKILCGGEALPSELASQLQTRGASLWNMYGPTETTIWSTLCRLTTANGPVTIGRPIDNTQVYIVDEKLQPTPVGVPGELLIGGDGVAVGYLNQPELTSQKFIVDPFRPGTGSRLYRTGDSARYHRDGNIEILGRIDHQIKLRGFRIELGEIESVLRAHDKVRDAVVILREDSAGLKRLVAYVSLRGTEGKEGGAAPAVSTNEISNELKNQAKAQLPDYMVPSAIVILPALPRTPNGKIDRKALPAPAIDLALGVREFLAPRNPMEQLLANIWTQVLGLEKVSVTDNFFELGGDSLLSFRVANRASQAGLPLTPRMFFEHNTIAALVNAAGKTDGDVAKPTIPAISRVSRDDRRRRLPANNQN